MKIISKTNSTIAKHTETTANAQKPKANNSHTEVKTQAAAKESLGQLVISFLRAIKNLPSTISLTIERKCLERRGNKLIKQIPKDLPSDPDQRRVLVRKVVVSLDSFNAKFARLIEKATRCGQTKLAFSPSMGKIKEYLSREEAAIRLVDRQLNPQEPPPNLGQQVMAEVIVPSPTPPSHFVTPPKVVTPLVDPFAKQFQKECQSIIDKLTNHQLMTTKDLKENTTAEMEARKRVQSVLDKVGALVEYLVEETDLSQTNTIVQKSVTSLQKYRESFQEPEMEDGQYLNLIRDIAWELKHVLARSLKTFAQIAPPNCHIEDLEKVGDELYSEWNYISRLMREKLLIRATNDDMAKLLTEDRNTMRAYTVRDCIAQMSQHDISDEELRKTFCQLEYLLHTKLVNE